ncbi:actin-like protein arp-6, partial [Haematococcus lacustris]
MGAGSRGPSAIIVIDNGAGNCKIGIGGEAAPRKVFPNCTAKPKGEKQMYVGDMLLDPKSE